MARPIKIGLDYFPFDTGFFSDKKIRRLRAKYGNDGIVVYIYLLCLIYGDKGYYVEYDEDLVLDISDELNISESSTRQILKYLLNRSLLCEIHDSKLVKPVTIISAKSIQRRFQEAKKGGKRNVLVKAGYWLLEKAETLGFIKVFVDADYSEKNEDFSGNNYSKSGNNSTKESKVNKSKLKCVLEIPCKNGSFTVDEDYYKELTHTYQNMDVIESLKALRAYMLSNPEKQRNKNAVVGCIEWWLSGDEEKQRYRKKSKPSYDLEVYKLNNTILEEEFS